MGAVGGLGLLLGLIFVVSGLMKLRDRSATAKAVASLTGLPPVAAKAVGRLLPWIELLLGGWLISGYSLRLAALTTGVVLTVFSVLLLVSLHRGRMVVCRCFGAVSNTPVNGWTVLRNALLTMVAAALAVTPEAATLLLIPTGALLPSAVSLATAVTPIRYQRRS